MPPWPSFFSIRYGPTSVPIMVSSALELAARRGTRVHLGASDDTALLSFHDISSRAISDANSYYEDIPTLWYFRRKSVNLQRISRLVSPSNRMLPNHILLKTFVVSWTYSGAPIATLRRRRLCMELPTAISAEPKSATTPSVRRYKSSQWLTEREDDGEHGKHRYF